MLLITYHRLIIQKADLTLDNLLLICNAYPPLLRRDSFKPLFWFRLQIGRRSRRRKAQKGTERRKKA